MSREKVSNVFPILDSEKVLFTRGHTLSLVETDTGFLGYLCHSDFSKLEVYSGSTIYSLANKENEIRGVRWASAIKLKDGKIRIYFTKQRGPSKLPFVNPYRYQTIYRADSRDGVNFSESVELERGSAPFPFRAANRKINVAFHRHDPHRILTVTPKGYYELLIFGKYDAVSAPSIQYFNEKYWLTVEAQACWRGQWNTLLYSGESILDLKLVDFPLLYNAACAFQHVFGDRYVITYSVKTKNGWSVRVREGKI